MAQPEDVRVQATLPGSIPKPPEELNKEEAKEWVKFTKQCPPNWFPPETWGMLAQLCRHVCQGRWVGERLQEVRAGLLDPTDDDAMERIERLQRMHDREGKAVIAHMVKLRITNQQRMEDAGNADKARDREHELPAVLPWMAPSFEGPNKGKPQ